MRSSGQWVRTQPGRQVGYLFSPGLSEWTLSPAELSPALAGAELLGLVPACPGVWGLVGLLSLRAPSGLPPTPARKATIYKWWPSKYAVAVDAFLSEMAVLAPAPDTGSVREDFRLTLRGLTRFYSSASGRVFAQLVAEAQADPAAAAELSDHPHCSIDDSRLGATASACPAALVRSRKPVSLFVVPWAANRRRHGSMGPCRRTPRNRCSATCASA